MSKWNKRLAALAVLAEDCLRPLPVVGTSRKQPLNHLRSRTDPRYELRRVGRHVTASAIEKTESGMEMKMNERRHHSHSIVAGGLEVMS